MKSLNEQNLYFSTRPDSRSHFPKTELLNWQVENDSFKTDALTLFFPGWLNAFTKVSGVRQHKILVTFDDNVIGTFVISLSSLVTRVISIPVIFVHSALQVIEFSRFHFLHECLTP